MAKITKEERLNDLEIMGKIVSKSKLTEKDAKEISAKIKKSATKKFNKYM